MNKTSDKAVADYLNNMFMDLTISESDVMGKVSTEYVPRDTNQIGFQLVPCVDPFECMNLEYSISPSKIWLAYLMILNLAKTLPFGPLKKYCLQQCQILMNQFIQQHCQ